MIETKKKKCHTFFECFHGFFPQYVVANRDLFRGNMYFRVSHIFLDFKVSRYIEVYGFGVLEDLIFIGPKLKLS